LANRKIASAIADSNELRGMATTASALLAGKASACVAHVGDSRVYVLRTGKLDQITHDHSWVEEQVRAGTMSPSAARQHPWRNVVTRALSGGEDPEVDVTEIEPQPGDRYLLCSDGLFSVVGDQEIANILGDSHRSLEEITTALIAAANAGGGPDNITALVLEVDVP
jgi:serine/threonine protein phosphatase PrpC